MNINWMLVREKKSDNFKKIGKFKQGLYIIWYM